jgi:DNA-binding transcriptional LysR family regulator
MAEIEDMRLLVRAIATGSLSAAGRELGVSPAVASKRLTRLENDLGARLAQRSSRHLHLTEEGAIYHERCIAILADIDEAERAVVASRTQIEGMLHVSAPVDLGRQWVAPAAAAFAAQHAQMQLRMSLSDGLVDLLETGVDVAVRIGTLDDSRLVSRRLARNRRVVCAAPAYLAKHGWPRTLADLKVHTCIVLQRPGMRPLPWTFRTKAGARTLRTDGRLTAGSGDLARDWALAGHGLAFKSIWDVAADIATNRLVPLFADQPSIEADIHVVYPTRHFLPARMRAFIDSLDEKFSANEKRILAYSNVLPARRR